MSRFFRTMILGLAFSAAFVVMGAGCDSPDDGQNGLFSLNGAAGGVDLGIINGKSNFEDHCHMDFTFSLWDDTNCTFGD